MELPTSDAHLTIASLTMNGPGSFGVAAPNASPDQGELLTVTNPIAIGVGQTFSQTWASPDPPYDYLNASLTVAGGTLGGGWTQGLNLTGNVTFQASATTATMNYTVVTGNMVVQSGATVNIPGNYDPSSATGTITVAGTLTSSGSCPNSTLTASQFYLTGGTLAANVPYAGPVEAERRQHDQRRDAKFHADGGQRRRAERQHGDHAGQHDGQRHPPGQRHAGQRGLPDGRYAGGNRHLQRRGDFHR